MSSATLAKRDCREHRKYSLGFQLTLLRSREKHVVENKPVARGIFVELQVRRWIADKVRIVLWVMPSVEGEKSTAIRRVEIFHLVVPIALT